jgi:regulator of RNase E activity RraA
MVWSFRSAKRKADVNHTYTLDEISSKLFSAVLSDILDSVGITGQVANQSLRPLHPDMRVVGYARTARGVTVNRVPAHPYVKLLGSIDSLTNEQVLIIGLEPTSVSAMFGGLLATAVQVAGGRGVIVDGNIRDAKEIESLGMPTFMRGLLPLDSYGRDEIVEVDGPIDLGGVLVYPGDLVLADFDGVVVVPQAVEDQVLTAAFRKVEGEGEVRLALRAGMSTADAFEKFGIL